MFGKRKYKCPVCNSKKLESISDNYGDDEDGIEQYYEDFFCEKCGTQITFLNGKEIHHYTIAQAEEDKWK